MKKKIICLLITLTVAVSVCCMLSLSADAASWEISGNLKFMLNYDGNSYTVAAANTAITTADIPSTFKGKPVTSIDESAFYGCSGLASVTMPASVTSIGDYAFSDCSGLTNVTIPNRVTSISWHAFQNCSGLTSVTIPNSVTSIGGWAFYGCSGLTSVEIPNSVTSIGYSAFSGCSGLTSVTIGNSGTSIGSNAFYGCSGLTSVYITDIAKWCGIEFGSSDANPLSYAHNLYLNGELVTDLVIPDGVTSIRNYAFYKCTGLTSVTMPNSVTSIGEYAFYACDKLASITIPDSVTSIGGWAFWDCSGLTSVFIPNSVTSIGARAFWDCSGLTSVFIPNSVTRIGYSAFSGCSGLAELSVDGGNTVYHSSGNCIIETAVKTLVVGCKTSVIPADGSVTSIGDSAFEGCSGLTSVFIPNSVTSIGNSAFVGCSGLTSVVIPNSVTSIGGGAFYNCSKLTSVTIGNGVTSIGYAAFYECSGLKSVTIPNSVTSIGNSAFSYCSGLTSVEIPNSVTSIGSSAFSYCSNLETIYFNGTQAKWKTISKGLDWHINAGKDTAKGTYALVFNSTDPIIVYSGECGDNLTWKLTDDGTLTISSTGAMRDYKRGNAPWYKKRESILKIEIENGVTSIGESAFWGCSGLKSVEIPNSVTWIGQNAFYECGGLKSVEIPNSVTSIGSSAFEDCSGLTSVTIGNGVTSIGNGAFRECSGLTSVEIPNSVTSIGDWAFSGCSGLTSVTIGNSVTSIGDSAFAYCNNLETIYFNGTEAKWKTICKGSSWDISAGKDTAKGKYTLVFNSTDPIIVDSGECGDNLTWKLTDDGTLTISSTGAMRDYEQGNAPWYGKLANISKIKIENGVESIGDSTFVNCTSLTSIEIPDSVTSIGDSAFENCNNLETIYFNGSEAKWKTISKGSDWDINAGKNTAKGKYTLVFLCTGYTVSGTATSFGSQTDNVTIQLIKSGTSEAAYEAVVQGNESNYSIENVESGAYTLRISKKNHVTREYTVTIGDDNFTQDVIIYLAGDVNGDGKINGTDYLRIRGAFLKTYTLSDEFLKVADVNGDGRINGTDYLRVRGHYLGTYNLYK